MSQREEFEEDLVAFCDRALDLLGDISGLDVLCAGGSTPLWLEGLADRIGTKGSLTALEADAGRVDVARHWLAGDTPACAVRIVQGDVFEPPFAEGSFDLAYSAGLFHELDVSQSPSDMAIQALTATLRPGGRLATDDFVDSEPAAQLEDEALEAVLRQALTGEESFGIGAPGRLVVLHQRRLDDVEWRILPPFGLRHLGEIFLAEPGEEPEGYAEIPKDLRESLRQRRAALRGRVSREGYTRPATLYVEGRRPT